VLDAAFFTGVVDIEVTKSSSRLKLNTQLYLERSDVSESVEVVNPLLDDQWDSLLKSYANATIFHGSLWARVLCETYGYQPAYFLVRHGNRLLGLLPCMEVGSWFTGYRGVALPFTDRSEALIAEDIEPGVLLSSVLKQAGAREWRSFVLHGESSVPAFAIPSLAFYTHSLDLSLPCDRLFKGCKDTVRRHVRQAQRNGLVVEIGSSSRLMDAYYSLHCLTRKKHGIPPQPVEFFRSIQRNLLQTGLGFVTIARAKARPVAGAVFLHQGTRTTCTSVVTTS
jgi:hypothetical protein